MINSKQRAYLKSLAHNIKPITQIGKEGLTDAFLSQLDDALNARELVKISILDTSGLEAKETANHIAKTLRAEFVQAIGSKFVLYRKSLENPKIEFPKRNTKKVNN